MSMTHEEALASVGMWVRVLDKQGRIGGSQQHARAGKIWAVNKNSVIVKIMHGHHATVEVPLTGVSLWKSRNGIVAPKIPTPAVGGLEKKKPKPNKVVSRFDEYDFTPRAAFAPIISDKAGIATHSGERLDISAALKQQIAPPAPKVEARPPLTPPAPQKAVKKVSEHPWWEVKPATVTPAPAAQAKPAIQETTSMPKGHYDRVASRARLAAAAAPTKPHNGHSPEGESAESRTRTVLTPKQRRHLEDVLIKEWERITTERPTKADACREYTSLLGFRVDQTRLDAALEAIDKKNLWPENTTRSAGTVVKSPAVICIAKRLSELYERFGEQVPHDLHQIASVQPMD